MMEVDRGIRKFGTDIWARLVVYAGAASRVPGCDFLDTEIGPVDRCLI